MVLVRDHDIHGLLFFRVKWWFYYRKEVIYVLKYILIWFCIGYVMTLIYFIYYYNFDVNMVCDEIDLYTKTHFSDFTDEDAKEIRSNNTFVQIMVGIIVIILMTIWPVLIVDFVRTFKRKLR